MDRTDPLTLASAMRGDPDVVGVSCTIQSVQATSGRSSSASTKKGLVHQPPGTSYQQGLRPGASRGRLFLAQPGRSTRRPQRSHPRMKAMQMAFSTVRVPYVSLGSPSRPGKTSPSRISSTSIASPPSPGCHLAISTFCSTYTPPALQLHVSNLPRLQRLICLSHGITSRLNSIWKRANITDWRFVQ